MLSDFSAVKTVKKQVSLSGDVSDCKCDDMFIPHDYKWGNVTTNQTNVLSSSHCVERE